MIKHYLLFVGLLFSLQVIAQTGIGTASPHPSAKLEVASDRLGFLPPQVTLTGTTDITTIKNAAGTAITPAVGLLVFNAATAGTSPNNVVPGYYYWNGTSWLRLVVPTDNLNNITGVVSITKGGTGTTTATGSGSVVLYTSPTIETPVISSGSTQFPSSVFVTPTTFASSKRASLWLDNWGLLQDFNGDGTRNFSITQNFSNTYPTRFFISTNGSVGIGNSSPGATLEIGSSNGSVPGSLILNPTTTGSGIEGAEINLRPAPATTSPAAQTWVIDQVSNSNNPRLRIFPSVSGETRGFSVLDNGNLGIGTGNPTAKLNLVGGGIKIATGFNNSGTRPELNTTTIGAYEIRGVGSGGSGTSQNDGADDGFLRLSAGGGSASNAQSSIDISGFSTQGDMSNNIVMRTLGTERLRITNEGRVGIGTNLPSAPLHVSSFVNQNVNTYGIFNFAGVFANNPSGNHSYSIQADQFIRASQFHAISDVRIKNNISQLNTQIQLSELNKLHVVNYSYIDQLKNGNKTKTGFIAQEVEGVNNQFVNQSEDFIPSVFALANSANLRNNLLQVTTDKPHDFKIGDIVKFYVEGKREMIKQIQEVSNSHSFSVKGWDESINNLFIYGKKVNDFRAIDFDQITALSVAAIQELSMQIDILKGENENLKKSITEGIEARLLKLEAKMNQ